MAKKQAPIKKTAPMKKAKDAAISRSMGKGITKSYFDDKSPAAVIKKQMVKRDSFDRATGVGTALLKKGKLIESNWEASYVGGKKKK